MKMIVICREDVKAGSVPVPLSLPTEHAVSIPS
jgi:hypothetical protein